jgi:tetratricopeptide (TPR) repeat protein
MRRWLGLLALLTACAHAPTTPLAHTSAAQQSLLYRQGVALAQQGDLTRAEEYLAAAHRGGGRDGKSLSALLGVCVRASRLRSALAYAQPFLHEHPDEPALWLLVSSVQLALGESLSAQRSAEQALRAESVQTEQAAAAHYLLGRLSAAQAEQARGRDKHTALALARQHYTRYLALAPAGQHSAELRAVLRR